MPIKIKLTTKTRNLDHTRTDIIKSNNVAIPAYFTSRWQYFY